MRRRSWATTTACAAAVCGTFARVLSTPFALFRKPAIASRIFILGFRFARGCCAGRGNNFFWCDIHAVLSSDWVFRSTQWMQRLRVGQPSASGNGHRREPQGAAIKRGRTCGSTNRLAKNIGTNRFAILGAHQQVAEQGCRKKRVNCF
jgi:hypothetical protein